MKRISYSVAVLLVTLGCGVNPGKNPDPVEVSGQVSLAGKPVNDVILNFQATGAGAQATMPVKNGVYKGSVIPGKYTFFLSEGSKPAAFKLIPEKYRTGSLERQFTISESGRTLNLALDQ